MIRNKVIEDAIIANFVHISNPFLLFLLLALNI